MAKEVKLPQLGETMEEGTIVGCLVKVGDEVQKGDFIFEIETDKAALQLESPAAGFVRHIPVELDQAVLVGQTLLVLGEKDEELSQDLIDSLKTKSKIVELPADNPDTDEFGIGEKKIVDLSTSGETAETAIIDRSNIKLGQTIPFSRLQKITAKKMLQSKQQKPCFYLTISVDMTDLVDFRAKCNQTNKTKISYNDIFIKAVGIGLELFPLMTGRLIDDATFDNAASCRDNAIGVRKRHATMKSRRPAMLGNSAQGSHQLRIVRPVIRTDACIAG